MSVDDLHRPTNKIIEPTKNSEVGGPAKSMFDEFHKQEASNFIDIRKARELAGDKPAPGRTNADTGVAFGGAAGPLMRHQSIESETISPDGTKREKRQGRKVDMDNLDVSDQGKYMPNKLPFGNVEQDIQVEPSLIKLKKTRGTKSPQTKKHLNTNVDNAPLNLGPPDIESDEEDGLQKMLLN